MISSSTLRPGCQKGVLQVQQCRGPVKAATAAGAPLGLSKPFVCRRAKLNQSRISASLHSQNSAKAASVVSVPVEQLSDSERQQVAHQYGYSRIGKTLPDGVTLSQIVKSMPSQVFDINPLRAWSAVAITLASVAASLYLIAIAPWYLLPLAWAFAGTAWTGFFVVGHDCGHRAFSKNKLVEDIVGTLMFAPLIYPFEPWRIKHNHHHAHTNKLVEDTAWHPVSKQELTEWKGTFKGWLFKTFLGSPLKSWASVGHWLIWHFDLSKYSEKQQDRVKISLAAVYGFMAVVFPALIYTTGITGFFKFWLMPWLGYHFWMSTFTVVHHTAPHIPFRDAKNWDAAQAQLSGTVHCDFPKWVEFLTHDISVHVPHHVASKIPWYNLRMANDSLRQNWGQYMTECKFNWRMMKTIFTELHVYDEDNVYVPFDFQKEEPFLQLQRKILPNTYKPS